MIKNELIDTRINYTYVFEFEEEFEYKVKMNWMQSHWKLCFFYVGIYMLLIFLGKHWMIPRARFELRTTLAVWNLSLAVFSMIGTCRTLPEMIHVWNKYGFQYTVCSTSYNHANPVTGFWVWLFTLSKVPELGDTVFIILRKQRLIFLHWYHHVTVLLYTWYSYQQQIAAARWFILMNYTVHAAMYSYYAFRAMRFGIPRPVAMAITTAQLLQMVVGLYVNWWAYGALTRGDKCGTNFENIKISLLMYASYFVLFANFFYNSYMKSQKERAESRKIE
uniref:Elongation of very long chain fatty acids protein n=1 Tax=Strigamia maritima TaxID=126957 RepID=T1JIU5_STRMM